MNPENEQAPNDTRTWVVDEANGLSELETRLNHLEGEGFAVSRVFVLRGLQPQFVILACRRHSFPTNRNASLKPSASTRRCLGSWYDRILAKFVARR